MMWLINCSLISQKYIQFYEIIQFKEYGARLNAYQLIISLISRFFT